MNEAWAQNAVVISDNGTQVKYHTRCPFCGHVNTMSTGSIFVSNSICNTNGNCPNCFKSFPLKFGRR